MWVDNNKNIIKNKLHILDKTKVCSFIYEFMKIKSNYVNEKILKFSNLGYIINLLLYLSYNLLFQNLI